MILYTLEVDFVIGALCVQAVLDLIHMHTARFSAVPILPTHRPQTVSSLFQLRRLPWRLMITWWHFAGGYAEKIFFRQVENLLSDLQQHLQE